MYCCNAANFPNAKIIKQLSNVISVGLHVIFFILERTKNKQKTNNIRLSVKAPNQRQSTFHPIAALMTYSCVGGTLTVQVEDLAVRCLPGLQVTSC